MNTGAVAGRPAHARYRDILLAIVAELGRVAAFVEPADVSFGLRDPDDEVYLVTATRSGWGTGNPVPGGDGAGYTILRCTRRSPFVLGRRSWNPVRSSSSHSSVAKKKLYCCAASPASKRRSTRSGAGRALGARHVVRGPLRRLTPGQARLTHHPSDPLGTLTGVPSAAMNPGRSIRPSAAFARTRALNPSSQASRAERPRWRHAWNPLGETPSTRAIVAMRMIRSDEPVDLPGAVS